MKTWKKSGFNDFSKGTFGNGGQNLYVSANGVLQYDTNCLTSLSCQYQL